MAMSSPEEFLTKSNIQPVRLGIQKGVDEVPAGGLSDPVQIDRDFTIGGLQFIQQWLQRVALSIPAQGDLFHPVSACNQDAGILKTANQVEKQAPGAGVHPLQVIQG